MDQLVGRRSIPIPRSFCQRLVVNPSIMIVIRTQGCPLHRALAGYISRFAQQSIFFFSAFPVPGRVYRDIFSPVHPL